MRYYIFNTEKEAREVSLRVYTNGIDWIAEVPAYVHVDKLNNRIWLLPEEATDLGYFE